ncbi:hypothetical protein ABT56_19090 [Photobacterium aquae]|uniref:Uncharacterized protein n=1 Tax=Photobacterium aquae TaxID=1195763 RepID=A0A0J1GUW5_9GAMM|nr:hypothetical protein [Photobacterium aquae]KLV03535.1 hypothetical protein ABT56_19090 [Photobacterium aquae]
MNTELSNFIKLAYRVSPNGLQTINVKPMFHRLSVFSDIMVEPKMCYQNSFDIMSSFRDSDANINITTIKYVLGFASNGVLVPHAWIKIHDSYYDPTWEVTLEHLGNIYVPVVELDYKQMAQLTKSDSMNRAYPVMLDELRSHQAYRDLFI